MWTLFAVAHAAPVGFWHPDDLAPLSAVFVASSERLQGPFEQRSSDADRLAAALNQYREALDLLGERAPAAERARLEALEKEYNRQHAVLQQFADQLVSDYDAAFTGAVERAASSKGEVVQCAATVRSGPALPGMPSRAQSNPDCPGANLNAAIAAVVDADAGLKAALDEILSRPWPEIGLESAAQAPIGGQERWMAVRDLMVAGARERLQQIVAADDEARDAIEAAIEEGSTLEQLTALEPAAKKIEGDTAAKRASLAGPLLELVEARIAKKWKGEVAPGWCANPEPLGGCTGADESRALVARLVEDPKIAKAFAR
ncbi:MAG: hypothetical protein ABMA64_41190 [Myxococcota bacterium]